jgi:hypothetical protein
MALEGMAQRTPTNPHCHPDPCGAAQGMLREGSHRMALGAMARGAAAMSHGIAPRKR